MGVVIIHNNNKKVSSKGIRHLHKDHKEKEYIQRQVQEVANKFQVKCVHSLSLPLPFHKHVTYIENILDKC